MSVPVIPESLKPLGVWDANHRNWMVDTDARLARVAWLNLRGISTDRVYRVEFYLVDEPFAVLRRFAVNEDGYVVHDPETDGPKKEDPVVRMLGELPPAHLLAPSS